MKMMRDTAAVFVLLHVNWIWHKNWSYFTAYFDGYTLWNLICIWISIHLDVICDSEKPLWVNDQFDAKLRHIKRLLL